MRRCDEIGKTVFKIYNLVNTMKPLIKDPNITIDQFAGRVVKSVPLDSA